jgi:hypothetical protein
MVKLKDWLMSILKDKRRQYGEWFNMTDAEASFLFSKLKKYSSNS